MIHTKTDLKYYLYEDYKRFGKRPTIKDWILKNEWAYIYKYLKILRYLEYYENSKNRILYYCYFLRYKRMCFNLGVDIKTGNLGPGARIMHLGSYIRIRKKCQIGKNCTILPGVIIGNKYLEENDDFVTIGDNCYLGLGVKIFGNITIGDNVTIGANSVVTKSIPDNAIVGGVPAKVIRFKNVE